ncbi:hypothetical protein BST61_g8712 [Cercospora zeina]
MARPVGATPGDVPKLKPVVSRVQDPFASGQYSDLKITRRSSAWNVHRNIVCLASKFFESCCNNFKEAQTGIIDLPDDGEDVVHALLSYIYTADYKTNEALDYKMLFQVRVHTIADKYDCPGLCQLAESKFAAYIATDWQRDSFATAVEEMYVVAPDSKKGLVAPFAYAVSRELMALKFKGSDRKPEKRPAKKKKKTERCSV